MRTRELDDDSGAVLILALLFVLVVGLVGGALVGFSGSSLAQTSVFNTGRSQAYAAESAIQVAIQQIRNDDTMATAPGYSAGASVNPCPTTSVTIPESPGGANPTNVSIDVMCAVGQEPVPYEREIMFAACPSGTAPSNCLTSPSFVPKPQPGALLVADTRFEDLAKGCSTTQAASCFVPGTSVDVNYWNVAQSDN
jgi:hypothetical protein